LPALEALETVVFAISTDDLSGAKAIASRVGISFPVLYDPAADVMEAYGVYDLLGDGLATASTFVIDKQGVIRWKYVARSISDRPSVSEVLEQLSELDG